VDDAAGAASASRAVGSAEAALVLVWRDGQKVFMPIPGQQ
jgi:hypothetical protein